MGVEMGRTCGELGEEKISGNIFYKFFSIKKKNENINSPGCLYVLTAAGRLRHLVAMLTNFLHSVLSCEGLRPSLRNTD